MAERRAISSSIWDDEWFGSLDFIAMALWVGLFSRQADDQGRMLDNAALIGRKVFTYKDIPASDIEPLLEQFAQGGKIIRYEAGGKRYIQIVNWWEHQPMQYAVPSNFPPPPGWVDRYNTTYKGHKIVFNWQARETTPDGERLWGILNSLPKMSTWTSYLGTLNPNPNPNPNPNHVLTTTGGAGANVPPAELPEPPEPEPEPPPPQTEPGELGNLQTAFINASKLPQFNVTEDDREAYRKMLAMGATPDDVTKSVHLLLEKYGGGGVRSPSSLLNTIPRIIAERKREAEGVPKPKTGGNTNGGYRTTVELAQELIDKRKAERDANENRQYQ